MATNLNLVPMQPSIERDALKHSIMKIVRDRITELNLPLANYKNNTEFVLLVLNLIEHLVPKESKKNKGKKMDKKEMAMEILSTLLQLTPHEAQALSANIEFLHENSMIKKVSKFYAFCCGVKEYFTGGKK